MSYELTWTHKRHPYLILTDELWDVFCEFFETNWARYMGTTLWFKTGSIFYGLEFIRYQLDMSYYKWQITMYYWFYSYVAAQAKWLITNNYRLRHDSDKLELSVFYFNTARYWRLNSRHTKKHIWITCIWRRQTPNDPTVYLFFFL